MERKDATFVGNVQPHQHIRSNRRKSVKYLKWAFALVIGAGLLFAIFVVAPQLLAMK